MFCVFFPEIICNSAKSSEAPFGNVSILEFIVLIVARFEPFLISCREASRD